MLRTVMSLQEVCVYGVKTIWKVELIYESVAVESTCLLMVPVLSENKLGGGGGGNYSLDADQWPVPPQQRESRSKL